MSSCVCLCLFACVCMYVKSTLCLVKREAVVN